MLPVGSHTVPDVPPVPPDQIDHLMGAINLVRITVGLRAGYESLISSGHPSMLEELRADTERLLAAVEAEIARIS